MAKPNSPTSCLTTLTAALNAEVKARRITAQQREGILYAFLHEQFKAGVKAVQQEIRDAQR